jgi:hypothetical protein
VRSRGGHIVYLIALLLVVGGAITIWWHGRGLPAEWPADVSRELGHALIIAGLLAGTVDFYVKKHLVHAIQRDTAHYLVGWNLPETVQNKIRDLIRTPLIRRNMVVEIELTPSLAAAGPKFNVRYNISYDVVNVSSEPQGFQPYVESEEHNIPTGIQIQCTSTPTDRPATVTRGKGVVRAEGSSEKIPPEGDRGFQVSYSNENPVEYSDPIQFAYPTEGLTISISCPADVEATAAECPSEPTVMNDTVSGRVRSTWRYGDRKVFLTGEAVIIRWRKKTSRSAEVR